MSVAASAAFAPGRVNVIGEHTDYNDGLALPFAIAPGVTVRAERRSEPVVEAVALDLGERDRFRLADTPRSDGWRAYVRGAVSELRGMGYAVPGVNLEITGGVPLGAGLSSSAALEMALCLALIELAGDQPPAPIELAMAGQRIEHDWVGAQTGLLDQLASLHGQPHHAMLIDFRTLELTPVPLDLGEHRLVVLPSGRPHAHAASGYNRRRDECLEAAHRMGVESLRDALIQDLHMLPDPLARRARHVISENGRVLGAATALRRGDLEQLGRLLDISHASLRDDFEVSTEELEACVSALKAAGALGARLLGGGFGGSVLGLMPPGSVTPAGAIEVAPAAGARLLA